MQHPAEPDPRMALELAGDWRDCDNVWFAGEGRTEGESRM